MSEEDIHYLPRQERHRYQAFVTAHWTVKIEPPVAGWLTGDLHREFRSLLIHAYAREHLFCPTYCLMPDHLHLM